MSRSICFHGDSTAYCQLCSELTYEQVLSEQSVYVDKDYLDALEKIASIAERVSRGLILGGDFYKAVDDLQRVKLAR